MSGHSKFANIKHKKEKNDAAKGKIFTILGREIAVAVKRVVLTLRTTSSWHRSLQRQNPTTCLTTPLNEELRRLPATSATLITNILLTKAMAPAESQSSSML